MSKKNHLIAFSVLFLFPFLSANDRYRKGALQLAQTIIARSQPAGPRHTARAAREVRTPDPAIRAATIPAFKRINSTAPEPAPRKTRSFPLCSPTNRENPRVPQNVDVYKSRHGNFAFFNATITIKESLPGVNATWERVVVFYDNDGAQKVMEIADDLAKRCMNLQDVNISWEMVQYDDDDTVEGGWLNNLD